MGGRREDFCRLYVEAGTGLKVFLVAEELAEEEIGCTLPMALQIKEDPVEGCDASVGDLLEDKDSQWVIENV